MNTKRSKRSAKLPSDREFEPPTFDERLISPEDSERNRQGSSLASDLRATAETAGRAVREQVGAFGADIGHELSKGVEQQKTRGVEAMRAFAAAVDTAAQELEQQSPEVARYVHVAAESLRNLSGSIEGRSLNELMRSASDLARSRPSLYFAGAVAAGFALSRFLKSSAHHDDTEMTGAETWERSDISSYDLATGGPDHANP